MHSLLKLIVVIILFRSGSLGSYSNGKSRYAEFRGCNESVPLPKVQDDETPTSSPLQFVEESTEPEKPESSSSTSAYPQNTYYKPVILGPGSMPQYSPSKSDFAIGNRMQTFSFGNNRFSFSPNALGYNDIKEDKVPTLRPGINRLAQSVQAFRNTITGNRFFDMENSAGFLLYTRKNPANPHRLQLHNKELIDSSNFQADKPTKLIIHGFSDVGAQGEWVMSLKDAYLSSSESNVLVADFSTFETFLLFWSNLPVAASKRISDLISFLELTTGTSRENFHLIARAWGTHVAGVTGRMLQGRVGRITGLEPEVGVFGNVLPEYKLVSSDALFVDVVHVNGRRYFFHGSRFGLTPPTGHVDIYPNYSERNTGCPGTASNYGRFNFGFCQRGRGVSYFTDTIKYPEAHPMCQCKSFDEFKAGGCTCTEDNTKTYMGEYLSNKTRGVFQLAVPSFNPQWYRMLNTFRLASRL